LKWQHLPLPLPLHEEFSFLQLPLLLSLLLRSAAVRYCR
jgi:hypothetical protein